VFEGQRELGVDIEQMHVFEIEDNTHPVANMGAGTRIEAGNEVGAFFFQVHNHFITHLFDYIDVGLYQRRDDARGLEPG